MDELTHLLRGAEETLPAGGLGKKLAAGKPLRVKTGFDPTSPDLHLGHTVLMRKMRHFQECGHVVVFLIGDFTAAIGDPSGRDSTRPQLSRDEIERNAETYARQAFKILDRDKTEVRRNSEWFDGMDAAGVIRLAGQSTVARMLERNDFSQRFRGGRAISVHEFLYPLVQGYDSVMLNADVELGGTDQKFNLLVGRDLQRQAGEEGQCVLTMPLLEGLDGERKMSKSYGNHIGVDEAPEALYGKVMSVSDALMWRYFELLSEAGAKEVAAMRAAADAGENPMRFKHRLAEELTGRFCGAAAAAAAAAGFRRCVSGGAVPEAMPEVAVDGEAGGGAPALFFVLKAAGLVASSSEGRRLVRQGAVRVDGETVRDDGWRPPPGRALVVQCGKRRFARVTVTAGR